MSSGKVQIVKLGPMRIASISAFGQFPAAAAWKKLEAWAGPKGLLNNRNKHPVFGFRSSTQTASGGECGYEIWIKIGFAIEQDPQIRIMDYVGGPYAVSRCTAHSLADNVIDDEWNNIAEWCRNNGVRPGYHQRLEKYIMVKEQFNNLMVDLYYPIIY